jgi:hypothetical protein
MRPLYHLDAINGRLGGSQRRLQLNQEYSIAQFAAQELTIRHTIPDFSDSNQKGTVNTADGL